jgi:hypothetical protein
MVWYSTGFINTTSVHCNNLAIASGSASGLPQVPKCHKSWRYYPTLRLTH